MDNMDNWFAKFHDQGPNRMILPPPRYTEILQSHKEPPMRVLMVTLNMDKEE